MNRKNAGIISKNVLSESINILERLTLMAVVAHNEKKKNLTWKNTSVRVIIIGNDFKEPSSNSGCLHFTLG